MNREILIYQNQDSNIKIDVRLENETVWLTQEQMALLFGKAKSTINEHIQNIYQEGELEKEGTLQKFGNSEFQQKAPYYYNLDVIISVGYRVKSVQGTQFRIWATQRLKEYIIKGFTSKPDKKVVDMENTNPQDDIKISTFVKSIQTGVEIPKDLDYKKAYGDYLIAKH